MLCYHACRSLNCDSHRTPNYSSISRWGLNLKGEAILYYSYIRWVAHYLVAPCTRTYSLNQATPFLLCRTRTLRAYTCPEYENYSNTSKDKRSIGVRRREVNLKYRYHRLCHGNWIQTFPAKNIQYIFILLNSCCRHAHLYFPAPSKK